MIEFPSPEQLEAAIAHRTPEYQAMARSLHTIAWLNESNPKRQAYTRRMQAVQDTIKRRDLASTATAAWEGNLGETQQAFAREFFEERPSTSTSLEELTVFCRERTTLPR